MSSSVISIFKFSNFQIFKFFSRIFTSHVPRPTSSAFCLLPSVFCLLLFFCQYSAAQYPGDSAKVFLITVSPGEEIYSHFGHSALRILEPRRGIDITYGYGMFDFSIPHFYEKFVFGRLLYCISADRFEDFMEEYKSTGQEVYQQLLNLTNKEKYQLIMNLQINYRPENRWYRYDFLYDNCSTRIRDIIEKSVDGKIEYDSSFIKKQKTFRDLLSISLENEPWVSLGINTMLGTGSDKTAAAKEYMFLPCYLMKITSGSGISTGKNSRQLTGQPVTILKGTIPVAKLNLFNKPETYFVVLFFLALLVSYLGYRKNLYSRWFDIVLFSVTGVLGLLFSIIWIGSLHKVMAYNINILWANPLNFIIAIILILNTKHIKWFRHILILFAVILLLYIPCSIITFHHLFTVPLMIDILLLSRLLRISLQK